MSHPSGPDQPEDVSDTEAADEAGGSEASEAAASPTSEHADAPHDPDPVTEVIEPDPEHEPATEIMAPAPRPTQDSATEAPAERRFTAPSNFDAGTTQRMDTPAEPATEVFTTSPDSGQARSVAPQMIPPRGEAPGPPQQRRSWGWVVALVLVIAALVAIAVLGTILLTRDSGPKVSQEDMVRATIEEFDAAIQSGDLARLRSITCGATRDSYVRYDDRTWAETHDRVAAAKQYPVVASIDQVIINGDHAEANVTSFMAYAPQTRSTRSFDLQFRDDSWKICQAPQ
ncbi:Rv0361 family membrane protein [Mycobacterium sp. IDR2000157661]|uniref:Rv0361 family membrane protein n=1 Tax=Mycobacterium sp. IDR2000157661 TaxID=2867005 RepID=UPI001EEAB10A|nr:DUF4878 domain-containing protein [Mycobacterium sp. IDR2000157661]ULE34318.1 DUF4878 domain-containing protein [Mycobacterium sp. IDR2000157661]